MARLFDDGANEYLNHGAAVLAAAPITMAGWFNSDDVANLQSVVSINDGGNNFFTMQLEGDRGAKSVRGFVKSVAAGVQISRSTTFYTANTWRQITFVIASAISRTIYLDAGGAGANNVNCVPLALDATQIGVHKIADYMSGRIAEVALWNIALTVAEIAILAAGYSPLFVHPQNLVAYWPLIRDEDQDRVGGYDMTPINGPGIAAHPPVIYPAPRAFMMAPAGAPVVGQPMMLRATTVPGLRQWHPRV